MGQTDLEDWLYWDREAVYINGVYCWFQRQGLDVVQTGF